MANPKANSIYLGIMSGTSLDGIDVAACRFDKKKIELIALHSEEWKPTLRTTLMELATAERVEMNTLARTHFLLAKEYAAAVETTLVEAQLSASDIRAIGLHGQTVRHLPSPPASPTMLPATLQLGSGAALAALSGIDVVSDFRSADVALGGQGAPLVPMFDFRFLTGDSSDRLIVNIGGIANVTWLPKNARPEEVIAFDTGPGNMLLDAIAHRYFDRPFDENGDLARTGTIDSDLLASFLSHPYFAAPPPKSTGRELFSEMFLASMHRKISEHSLAPQDALATLTELTARSITESLRWLHAGASSEIEVIVSGGGAYNSYLLERMSMQLPSMTHHAQARIDSSDAYGIPPKAKEAIAFAFFAQAFVEDIPIHLPSTTGAARHASLGSLSRG